MALTDTRVKAAKPRLSDYTLADGNGLYLRVRRRTGTKTWITRRMIAGKVHVQTIGVYDDIGLAEARLIAAGKAIGNEPPDKRTVKSLGEQYALRVLERRYKNSRPVVRYLERDIYPHIGSKRVGDVMPADVDRVLQAKLDEAGPVATNMLLMLSRACLPSGCGPGGRTPIRPRASPATRRAASNGPGNACSRTTKYARCGRRPPSMSLRSVSPCSRAAGSPRRAGPGGRRSTSSASVGLCRRARRSRGATTGSISCPRRSRSSRRSRGPASGCSQAPTAWSWPTR